MKKILMILGFAAVGASNVLAADLPARTYTKAPVLVAPVHNWTGCYIGANVGGKWATTRSTAAIGATTGSPAVSDDLGRGTSSTAIGGGQIGCNWQTAGSNWVFGLEGDVDGQDWKRSARAGAAAPPPFISTDAYDLRSSWQASIRGRIGYAWDRWLVYGTGGLALTEVRSSAFYPVFGIFPASAGSDSKTLVGGTVGGGIEYALDRNWSLGLEGRYSWYGTHTFEAGTVAAAFVPGAGFLQARGSQTVRVETGEVTLRLNYKFGGPVVAKF